MQLFGEGGSDFVAVVADSRDQDGTIQARAAFQDRFQGSQEDSGGSSTCVEGRVVVLHRIVSRISQDESVDGTKSE